MSDAVLALIMALLCILLHFEAVLLVGRVLVGVHSPRLSLLVTWMGLLTAHVVQIWLYAMVYWLCARWEIGYIDGVKTLLDYVYFSSVVYTTLGFGDLIPGPGIQILTGSEALVGLCLIAWSATITFSRVLFSTDRHLPPT